MGNLMKTYLLAFLMALVSVEMVYAAATKFTDLEVKTLQVDSAQGLQLYTVIASSLTTPARAVNVLGVDSSHVLYISTATTGACWVKVGSQ